LSTSGDGERVEELSLFYPMYNEAENLDEAVRRARELLPRVARTYEIILVDDGSRDATGVKADASVAADPLVRVLHHEVNRGYGAALQSGIRASRYRWIFYTDGDNQFDLGELPKFLEHREEADQIIGYRSPPRDPFYRRVNAAGFNLLAWILLGVHVKDVDCAFKLLRASIFERMELVTEGPSIDLEILARARRQGATWLELPVRHYPRRFGNQTGANLRVILRAVRELVRLSLALRGGAHAGDHAGDGGVS
jgi:glycosyltransferase involved in cell wall biosynthesis